MNNRAYAVSADRHENVLATNKVIRNTFMLLSMTILFSALMATVSIVTNLQIPFLFTLGGYFGLLYLVHTTAHSAVGLVSVFAFTGFMGLTIGPILNMYIYGFSNGPQIVAASLGATGVIFFSLSGYAMTSQRNFNYLGGFLFTGMMIAILASIAGMFFQVPALHLAVSSVVVMLMSGYILFETSQLVHGAQTNYILATVSLYVTLFNLFINLLHIIGSLAGNRD